MSAVIPTFIAQKWFMPAHSEDTIELDGNGGENNYESRTKPSEANQKR
jgi:hypothetical protein